MLIAKREYNPSNGSAHAQQNAFGMNAKSVHMFHSINEKMTKWSRHSCGWRKIGWPFQLQWRILTKWEKQWCHDGWRRFSRASFWRHDWPLFYGPERGNPWVSSFLPARLSLISLWFRVLAPGCSHRIFADWKVSLGNPFSKRARIGFCSSLSSLERGGHE